MDDIESESAFMRRAIVLSELAISEGTGFPFGAVIVRGDSIVAEGFNHVFAHNDPTAHAEIVAIRLACERIGSPVLVGCTIYSSSEPCPMCLSAIYWAGLDKIYFANDLAAATAAGFGDARIYREIAQPAAERALPMVQLLAAEGKAAFDAWQSRPQDSGPATQGSL